MNDEIKVHVCKYPDRENLVMRYKDPITGRQVQRSTKTTKHSKAVKAAGKWEAEVNEGRYKKQSRTTWQEFTESYQNEKLAALADASSDAAWTAFNHIERTINPQRLAEMTTGRVAAFQTMLRSEGMKETTIATHLRQLRAALGWALRRGYLRAMPVIEMPERINEGNQAMRSRAVTLEEVERMAAKVGSVRKREPEKWKRLLHGLYLGGLRLSEALALSWDDGDPISVSMAGKYPALLIHADAQKNHSEDLLPLVPEFCEFLLAVPKAERTGLVFGIYGKNGNPLSTKRASRYISAIGKAANVVTNKAEGKHASAHDLRRAFCTRWAKRVMPLDLQRLARHADVSTTQQYYITQDNDELGERLRSALGTNSGTIAAGVPVTVAVDIDANGVTILG